MHLFCIMNEMWEVAWYCWELCYTFLDTRTWSQWEMGHFRRKAMQPGYASGRQIVHLCWAFTSGMEKREIFFNGLSAEALKHEYIQYEHMRWLNLPSVLLGIPTNSTWNIQPVTDNMKWENIWWSWSSQPQIRVPVSVSCWFVALVVVCEVCTNDLWDDKGTVLLVSPPTAGPARELLLA